MNFGFDEQQKDLAETVAQVLRDHGELLAPDPADIDTAPVWDALANIGLFALAVPEQQGGVGLSLVDMALCVEALGAALAPPLIADTIIATDLIGRFGTEQQKDDLLPRIARGDVRIATAVLEAGRGYDPKLVETSIDGKRLTGTKILVPSAAEATHFLVLARAAGGPRLLLLQHGPRTAALRPHHDLDPSSRYCEVTFEGPSLMDDPNLGHKAADAAVSRFLDVAATVYAGLQLGIAGRMLDASVEYAKTRVQFGQPIGAFQAIKHRCADMAVAIEAGRSAAYYAFWAVAEDAPDRARASSMAKAYCGEIARDACNDAIQIHGGMGFTWELGLHRFLRRAKVLEHAFGNHAYHYECVVAATVAAQDSASVDHRDAA